MRMNSYYNKATMNYKQLACDLEKQGLRCDYDDRSIKKENI
jgi:hypothetical protein|nr:MAG TPA: hypothetical protein [Caudoviricetes sp.]